VVFLKWMKTVGPSCILFPLPAGSLTYTHDMDIFLILIERNETYIDPLVLLSYILRVLIVQCFFHKNKLSTELRQ